MPDVIGQSVATASSTLRGDGLIVTVKFMNSVQPSGTVLSSDPSFGIKVSHGESVVLQVSLGTTPAPVTIPDTLTMSLSNAESTLQGAGLSPKVSFLTTPPPPGSSPGIVLLQDPPGGTKGHAGDTVTITVLAASSTYPVPNLSGQTSLQAAATLGNAGLQVSASTASQCSNTMALNLVVRTVPGAGQLVRANSAVELITSSGYCDVVVATVVGQSQSDATAKLKSQGFTVAIASADPTKCIGSSIGTVASQSVAGGSSAPYHSTITLSVCDGTVVPTSSVPTSAG